MSHYKSLLTCIITVVFLFNQSFAGAQKITVNGKPGILEIREAERNSVRITLKPVGIEPELPYTPALAERNYTAPAISLEEISEPVTKRVAGMNVEVTPDPLRVRITNAAGRQVQNIVFNDQGGFSFAKNGSPILGMGEGGPRPERGTNWRTAPIQYDRNGSYHAMVPRWQSDAYGSRNPVALMIGTNGWALFVATPWGEIDLQKEGEGLFIPLDREPQATVQNVANQGLNQGKGLPPAEDYVKGLLDIFVFDAHDPAIFMKELSLVSGPAVMPPLWSLGYMQSHRTLTDEDQIIGIVDTFREKRIPIDAVIYLGTGFCPRGWNTRQPSFDFNPEVFKRAPEEVLSDLHARHVKVVVHMVPWDRDMLPTLQGTIPALPGEVLDSSHIQNYWQQHVGLMDKGIDAFWPDEGDWFNLSERIKRHQMYYQGPLSTMPDTRPWSLHRNGHLGIAQWGGWVWSGDTESSWKTLEGQIAVGINHSLSIGPYWGSDIGGFYPNNEKTGELYARWFQFGAFCGSFRSHGRTWFTALPWGWGLSDMGPREDNNRNTPAKDTDRRNPLVSEMNNPLIEPVVKKYAELHYQLLPYTYTLAWEAHTTGMPLMRAMWLQYPEDEKAAGLGNQYMWGPYMLIAPVFEKGATSRTTYLPEGVWYDWWNNAEYTGGKEITRDVGLSIMPIYVKAGAIIPLDPVRQYTGEPASGPTTIKVYPGADGQFTMYEDDGISQKYLEGIGSWTTFRWNDKSRKLSIFPDAPEGAVNLPVKHDLVIELVSGTETKNVKYSGKKLTVKL
jgi:alpha-glucosidase/alpha-D-xyloside xylohydrolase